MPTSSMQAATSAGPRSTRTPKSLQHVRRSAARAGRPVAVLGHSHPRPRGHEGRGGGDVEGAEAVAPRAHYVHEPARIGRLHHESPAAKGVGQTGDLFGGLPLHPQAHEERRRLDITHVRRPPSAPPPLAASTRDRSRLSARRCRISVKAVPGTVRRACRRPPAHRRPHGPRSQDGLHRASRRLRKLRSRSFPTTVRRLSGWNWTPSTANSR